MKTKFLLLLLSVLSLAGSLLAQTPIRIQKPGDPGPEDNSSLPLRGSYRLYVRPDGSLKVVDYLGNPVPPSVLFPSLTGSGSSTVVAGISLTTADGRYRKLADLIDYQTAIANKPVIPVVPTDLSAFSNATTGFQNAGQVGTAVNNGIGSRLLTTIFTSFTGTQASRDANQDIRDDGQDIQIASKAPQNQTYSKTEVDIKLAGTTAGGSSGTVPAHTHQTAQIIGFAADVNGQVLALFQSWPNWGPGRIIGTDANSQPIWLTPTYSGTVTGGTTTGGGSTTGTTPASPSTLAPYDSVLARIDTTAGRINVALMTVDSVRNATELRQRISTPQTNKDIVLTENFVDDNGEYVATGAFTNVRIRSAHGGSRRVTLKSTNSYKWNWNGSATRTQVELKDLIFRTTATTGSAPIVASYEQVPWDGYCMRNVTIKGKAQGSYNGLNFQQASGVSGGGALAKNIYWVNVQVDSIPRSNEMLCQVYNVDRVKNFVVAYSKFSNTGLNPTEFGSNFSVSGRFAGMLVYRSTFDQGNGPQVEFVNASDVIALENRVTSTTRAGVGFGLSDDGRLLTKNIFLVNNSVNVTARPWYDHDTRGTTIRGGTYIGRQGVEQKSTNTTLENVTVRVYDKTGSGVAMVMDRTSGMKMKKVTISSRNARLFGAVTTKEPLLILSNSSNNRLDSVTTIIGQQTDGTFYSNGAINNLGTNNTITANAFSMGVDTAAYVPPTVTAGTSDTAVVLLLDGNNQPDGATTINDRSTYNHPTVSRGSVKISTAEKKFGTGSIYFNGTSDFITIANTARTTFGTADFTMEFWIKPQSLPNGTIAGLLGKSTTDNKIIWTTGFTGSPTSFAFNISDAAGADTNPGPAGSGIPFTVGTWQHVAIVRSAGVTKLYYNGVARATSTSSPSLEGSGNNGVLVLGTRNNGGCCLFNGWMHAKVTKRAVYTADFTPPASF